MGCGGTVVRVRRGAAWTVISSVLGVLAWASPPAAARPRPATDPSGGGDWRSRRGGQLHEGVSDGAGGHDGGRADAVPLGAGTGGLALADVPDSWSFTFFSPGEMHAYIVDVQHGTVGEPRDFGQASKGTKIVESIDPATIKVGAAQAVVKARDFATQSGAVPKNVMVSGTFALTPTSEEAGFTTGVWTVTFATGTDLADAKAFTVDMMTGEVAKAPKQ